MLKAGQRIGATLYLAGNFAGLIDEEDFCPAVVQNVEELLPARCVIDHDEHRSRHQGSEDCDHAFHGILQVDGNGVAAIHARLNECVGKAIDHRVDLPLGKTGAIADEGRFVGTLCRAIPKEIVNQRCARRKKAIRHGSLADDGRKPLRRPDRSAKRPG